MKSDAQKLPVLEKIGYSLGDAGANFVFKTMIMFQLFFYTNSMGIAAWKAGSLLLVARLWDAFFDPMMGVIADRTDTRWGKFRPWILWSALPWGIVMILAYTTPDYEERGKLIYACVTNILLMTLYSVNNTPYSALTGVMTGDINERTSLSSYRFVSAMIAQLIVAGFTLPLVAKFGHGNDARGWQMTIGLWAVLCVILFVITFASTRERIQPDPKQKSSVRQDFGNLVTNGPWIALFTASPENTTTALQRSTRLARLCPVLDSLCETIRIPTVPAVLSPMRTPWLAMTGFPSLIVQPGGTGLLSAHSVLPRSAAVLTPTSTSSVSQWADRDATRRSAAPTPQAAAIRPASLRLTGPRILPP